MSPFSWGGGGGGLCQDEEKIRFEKWWMEREDFKEVVIKAWSVGTRGMSAMDTWQTNIRNFRRIVRGWAANVVIEVNSHKQVVSGEYNWLDIEFENRVLEDGEKNRMKQLAKELESIWALEEIKARQRSKIGLF
jgi:hypothetical protein